MSPEAIAAHGERHHITIGGLADGQQLADGLLPVCTYPPMDNKPEEQTEEYQFR